MISLPVLAASSPTLPENSFENKNHVKTFVKLDLKIIGAEFLLIAAPPKDEMA